MTDQYILVSRIYTVGDKTRRKKVLMKLSDISKISPGHGDFADKTAYVYLGTGRSSYYIYHIDVDCNRLTHAMAHLVAYKDVIVYKLHRRPSGSYVIAAYKDLMTIGSL